MAWDPNGGDCIEFSCGGATGNGKHGYGQSGCKAQGDDRASQRCTGAYVAIDCIFGGPGSSTGTTNPVGGTTTNPIPNPTPEPTPVLVVPFEVSLESTILNFLYGYNMEFLNQNYDNTPVREEMLQNLTDEQKQSIYNYTRKFGISDADKKEFIEKSVEILSLPIIDSQDLIDYEAQISRLTNHLRLFGNIEDEIYADYIDSLLPELSIMTMGEVNDIYLNVKQTCNELTIKYAKGIITPIVTDLVIPVITYAIFEASANTALKLLQKIPGVIFQGSRLSATASQLAQLGEPGLQSHVRIITISNPVSRAESLFLSLTKNVTPVQVSPGVLQASMGNNNFIIFRTVSGSGFPATIDLNFAGVFGTSTPIKVLKFAAP